MKININYRKASLLLAVVMLINSLGILVGVKPVYAAGAATLVPEINMGASHATGWATIPNFSNNVNDDQATMRWDFSSTDAPKDAVYTLSYISGNDEVSTLTVSRANAVATVSYGLARGGIAVTGAGFYVHQVTATTVENYVPASSFILSGNVGDDLQLLSTSQALFSIKQGKGVSFEYADIRVHFGWSSDGNFYYSVSDIDRGNIYKFELRTNVAGTTYPVSTREIFTGISDTLVSVPIANDNKRIENILDGTSGTAIIPGDDKVSLEISFDAPFRYDTTSKAFLAPDTSKLTLQMRFDGVGLKFGNINAVSAEGLLPEVDVGISITSLSKTGNRITFTIEGDAIKANTIFSNVILTPIDNDDDKDGIFISTRATQLEWGRVYTFLRYRVVSSGNKYYASFKPYPIAGDYTLYILPEGNPNMREVSVARSSLGNENELLMSLSVKSGQLPIYYQIGFIRAGTKEPVILSQILKYQLPPGTVEVDTPALFDITSSELVPDKSDVTGDKGVLSINFRWDVGMVSNIDQMISDKGVTIEYDLLRTLTPSASAVDIRRFATVTLSLSQGDMATGTALAISSSYSAIDGSAGSSLTTPTPLKVETNSQTGELHYIMESSIVVSAVTKLSASGLDPNNLRFLYPNIYFINMQPVRRDGISIEVNPSLYDNITLSDISRQEVPPPQNIKASGIVTTTSNDALGIKDQISFDLSFDMPSDRLRDYAATYNSYPKVTVNIYISQVETALRGTDYATGATGPFYSLSRLDKLNNSVSVPYTTQSATTFYFANIATATSMLLSDAALYGDPRAALRDNKIVCINGIPVDDKVLSGTSMNISYTLDGLDKNRKYYVYADIVVSHYDVDGSILPYPDGRDLIDNSKVSALLAVTTKGDISIPDPAEKVPPAPVLLVSQAGIKSDRATLTWNKIVPASDETIEYQLLRTLDTPMADEYLFNRDDFSKFWNHHVASAEKYGMQSVADDMQVYNGTSFVSADALKYSYNDLGTGWSLTDITLLPNRIYFYYLRTVKTVGSEVTYSAWSRVTVTSNPVQSPSKLVIESSRDYDHKTQVMFSFEAAADLSKLGNEYRFEYQLKEEGKDWSAAVQMDAETLRNSAISTGTSGIYKFLYTISGLKNGTSYTLRVRALDKDGAASIYTNSVTFRTDIDQKDYDEQDKLNAWSKYLKDELQKLIRDPYWLTVDTTTQLEAIYRPTMFNTQISEAVDSLIGMYGNAADTAVYYIPASSLKQANDATKGFKLVHEDMEIIIPAKSVDMSINAAFETVNARIKDGSINDYYIKVSFAWYEYTDSINGNTPVTDRLTVSFDVVGTTILAETWDSQNLKKLEKLVTEKAADSGILSNLEAKVKANPRDEELVKYVAEIVAQVKADYVKSLSTDFRAILSGSYPIGKLDKQIYIVAKNLDAQLVINGYEYKAIEWLEKETIDFSGGRAITTNTPGMFIFTSRALLLPGMDTTVGGGAITAIVSRYSLEDFFGRINEVSLAKNTSRDMLVGSIARIAGAPKGSEPYDWLNRNKKLVISKRNGQNAIETQEALYLVMALYEMKTNTKISSIQIRNYATTANIKGIDDKYKTHVRAAFETGLFTDKTMQPSANVSVKNMLTMLSALDAKAKL